MPKLPQKLTTLYCCGCPIKELPHLPKSLGKLNIRNTLITVLPELPQSLWELDTYNVPLLLKQEGLSLIEYNKKIQEVRIINRTNVYKEELMANTWESI